MSEKINVKNLRTSLKISQADFAKLLGVTQKTVSNWEAGKVIPESKIEMLQNLSNNTIVSSIISGNNCTNDNRQYYSDSPDVLRKQIEDLERTIAERERLLAEKEERIKEKDSQIKEKDSQIKEKDSQIKEKDSQIKEKDSQIKEKDSQIKTLLNILNK